MSIEQLNIKIRKYEKRDHDTVCRIFYNGLMENWVRVKLSAKFRGTQYWRMILGLGTIYNRFFLFRLHSLFLKKLHDIQICFQQDNVPTFLSVNFKPNVLWILKNDHESIGGASERKWKENYHNINIKKYFYTSSKKSSLCYHFDLINFSLLLLF